MSRIDYSVWDHIEVSDDEDDTHPNIDTPSLFRWRHQVQSGDKNDLQLVSNCTSRCYNLL